MNNSTIRDQVKTFYKEFNSASISALDSLYDDNIQFSDPFHHIEGIDNLKRYFGDLAKNTNSCRFVFTQEAENGEHVFLEWRMELSHPKIKNGAVHSVDGVSHLIIKEKIISHRDYFDTSEMLYKHIPLLGHAIKYIEKNMVR